MGAFLRKMVSEGVTERSPSGRKLWRVQIFQFLGFVFGAAWLFES
jgi:hypothetical protein